MRKTGSASFLISTITIITNTMATCTSCQGYYRKSPYNESTQCDECVYTVDVPLFDEEDSVEVEHLLNPNGKTQPHFYE